ncbi:MAG: hypothetical protein DHS20C19_23210 [Acidimicrobiales bacterium]|nr:MAG: hypothetical protein DHS20C19_23210 [Acidimicrobiales bacterium]
MIAWFGQTDGEPRRLLNAVAIAVPFAAAGSIVWVAVRQDNSRHAVAVGTALFFMAWISVATLPLILLVPVLVVGGLHRTRRGTMSELVLGCTVAAALPWSLFSLVFLRTEQAWTSATHQGTAESVSVLGVLVSWGFAVLAFAAASVRLSGTGGPDVPARRDRSPGGLRV